MNNVVAAKICGLTSNHDARFAEDAGADYLGVIFAGGPRLLTVEQAAAVFEGTSKAKRVAVFGNQPDDEIASIAERLQLDVVQLHVVAGDEQVTRLQRRLRCTIWPVVRVESSLPTEARDLAAAAEWLLVDSKGTGAMGGTGVALPWASLDDELNRLRQQVSSLRVVVAGGLRADNVAQAIDLLAPHVVDVSSGVEFETGRKSAEQVQAFIAAVKQSRRRGEVDAV